jgi:hypothetical protein
MEDNAALGQDCYEYSVSRAEYSTDCSAIIIRHP